MQSDVPMFSLKGSYPISPKERKIPPHQYELESKLLRRELVIQETIWGTTMGLIKGDTSPEPLSWGNSKSERTALQLKDGSLLGGVSLGAPTLWELGVNGI